jgi:hypothetical protein
LRRASLVGLLWRWHRRGGLLVALFVLFMAATGIVLNHGSDLGLDRKFIHWGWLRSYYGEKPAHETGFAVGERWVTRSSEGVVHLDARGVGTCSGELVGAVAATDMLYVACAQELLLLTQTGELIEALAAAGGLPAPLAGIAVDDDRVLLRTVAGWQALDVDAMTFAAPAPPAERITPAAPSVLPAPLREQLGSAEDWLSWERLLLDLHSGRLFGRAGVLVVDVAGLLFALLALSGVSMWWLHRHPRR